MPPDLNGHGGSQRAWHLIEALQGLGDIHFVLVFRDQDQDCVTTPLDALASQVQSVTRINIAGWQGFDGKQLKIFHPGLFELLKMHSPEAPKLSARELQSIASRLPIRKPDMIFAGRLCSAVIVQALIDAKLLADAFRIVDFDDIMSNFRKRQIRNAGSSLGRQGRLVARLDSWIIARAERRIANLWHGASVCTEADADALRQVAPAAAVAKIPNIVCRPWLPPRADDGRFRLLFIGNLGFSANTEGLNVFIREAWPALRNILPHAELTIVGINPPADIIALAAENGFTLAGDVPSVEPFYGDCDAVIVPILFGSGTRIKILEAMAFGRAVVSTPIGAEGMGLVHHTHLLLADTMQEFANALCKLATEPNLRATMTAQARAFQQQYFGPSAIRVALRQLVLASQQIYVQTAVSGQ